jgi:hypothetical protein
MQSLLMALCSFAVVIKGRNKTQDIIGGNLETQT